MQHRMSRLQRGFTLIEMSIVGIFLGLLALFVINSFSQKATASTTAKALHHGIERLLTSHDIFTQACGHLLNFGPQAHLTANFSSEPTTFQASTQTNFLTLAGQKPLAPKFASCYQASGLKPLTGLTTSTPPPAGTPFGDLFRQGAVGNPVAIAGIPIYPGASSYTRGGPAPQTIILQLQLPDEVALHFLNIDRTEPAYSSVDDMRARLGSNPINVDLDNPPSGYKSSGMVMDKGTIGVLVTYH